jgi:hypothetical protein
MMTYDEKLKTGNPLMEVFSFTESDLERNRVGFLGEQQQEQMKNQFSNSASLYSGVYAIAGVFGFLVLITLASTQISYKAAGIWIGLLVLVVLGLRVLIRNLRQPLEDDLKDGRVRIAEGVVKLDIDQNGSGYSLLIGDQTFSLTTKMFLAFKNLEPYRVYYLPYTRTIVSAEWLRE